MFLVAHWKINDLISKKADYEYQLTQITQEIEDLKTYAENIADSGVSIGEMLSTPGSMYGRQMGYMNASSQYSQISAMNQMQQLMQTPYYQQMMAKQDAQVQQYYQQAMYKSFYDQSMQQFAKYEAKLIHEKEKVLERKKTQIAGNLDICKTQIQNYEQRAKEGQQRLFGGNG